MRSSRLFSHITSQQRIAACIIWEQLLFRRQNTEQLLSTITATEKLQEEIISSQDKIDPSWRKRFRNELNSMIFENRENPRLQLTSKALPKDLLLQTALTCNLPLAVFPQDVSMSFAENNKIVLNDHEINAEEIIQDAEKAHTISPLQKIGLFGAGLGVGVLAAALTLNKNTMHLGKP